MTGFSKVPKSIVYSSIWQESLPVVKTWFALIALKDREGVVRCSVPGLHSVVTNAKSPVSIEEIVAALDLFRSPDPHSTTPVKEGRRIEDVEGGWRLINHQLYQEYLNPEERRAYWALKQREARVRKNAINRKIKKREAETMERAQQES